MARKKETRYGGKYKYIRRRVKGPDGRYGDVYGRDLSEVEDKLRQLELSWAADRSAEEDPYFSEYAAAWFRRVSGDLSAQRREDVRREINRNIAPVLGTKKLSEITSDDVADVMARRAGLSRSAQTKTLQILRRILAAAEDAGKLPRDPSRNVRAAGKPPARREALTAEQEAALLAAVAGQRVELFVRLGLYVGLRREEICGLAWKDVHLDGPAPHLDVRQACRWPSNNRPEISPKLKSSAAWRTVPIPPALLAPLTSTRAEAAKAAENAPAGSPAPLSERTVLAMADGTPWTFQSFRRAWGVIEARSAGTVKRRRVDPETGEKTWVPVERRLGDPVANHPGLTVSIDFDVSPHLLRHTYLTRLILGGVDVKRVQYLAGHETADVTLEIYTSLMGHRPEDLIDDVSAIFPA